MKVYRVDENGFYIEDVNVKSQEGIEDDMVAVKCPEGLYSPRWNGEKWIDGITKEELEEARDKLTETTKEELLEQRMDELELYILMQEGLIYYD